jgi:thymidylate kinase
MRRLEPNLDSGPSANSRMKFKFLDGLFGMVQDKALDYVILRNYETLPERVPGSDIDILCAINDLIKFEKAIHQQALECGWSIESSYEKNYRIRHVKLVRVTVEEFCALRFDISSDIGLGPFRLLDGRGILDRKQRYRKIYRPSEIDESLVNVINAYYVGTPIKEKYGERVASLSDQKQTHIRHELRKVFGTAPSTLAQLNMARGRRETRSIVLQLFVNSLRRSLSRTITDFCHWSKSSLYRIRVPSGKVVVLLGPDGIGKSTLCREISKNVELYYPAVKVNHLRPKLMRPLSDIRPLKSKGQAEEARKYQKESANLLMSLIRMAYYSVDYTLGYWVKIFPDVVKGNLVIFDRYFYDYHVDRGQKGVFLPDRFLRLIFTAFPKPDNVIVLTAPPQIVRGRRADLSEAALVDQFQRLENLSVLYPNVTVLSAEELPEVIATRILRAIHS